MELDAQLTKHLGAGADPTDAQFRLLVESVSDYAIYLLDTTGRVMSWNAGAERIKGYSAADILGRHFSVFYPLEERAAGRPDHMLEQAAKSGRINTQGWRMRKDGSRFWADVVITALRNRSGALTGYAKVTRDLTSWREANERIRESEARLQSLTRRLVQVEEAERRRIAGELHDRVGQTLSALNINLDIALGRLDESAPQELRMRLRDSLGLVDGTLQTIEDVMAELRPPLLEEYGLGAALGWYGEAFAKRTNIALKVDDLAPDRVRELGREAAVALFRIAQEALNNVAKHADATEVRLALEADDTHVTLSVRDNGRGFDPGASQARATRLGMTTMQERVVAAGGSLEIESEPRKGTTVRARVPF
ncbi:MAG TPA: PAS domain-containing sensor histidine kinase [Burkholderiales bacterium]|nr:PAS domain-containing sensor histidine kinase [Burkholderiales bacterium]